ncbi:MAG: aldehyde ferredoxin oxidoreductase family protein [Proteobacteria bacterium]|nr:aldehyde ferredoxin oxidoreductase family protein [Pseudomonadota bacterium]
MEEWTGKILRVDLTAREFAFEDIDPAMEKDYIGGRGVGTKILCDEVDPEVDPLSPENKLIFMTGPLTGTGAPCSARYMVITKSPLTGAIACSNSGGYFPAELRFAGIDGIIFEGKADEPVYLWINDDEIEIRSAADLWGKTTHETEDLIRAEISDPWLAKEIRIASIGPAGENLGKIACIINDKHRAAGRSGVGGIINDKHRAAGRSGVGAVMGSKNLKAVVVKGSKGIGKINRDAFKKAVRTAMDKLKAGPVTGQGLPKYGTAILVNIINECGILPTNNFQTGTFATAGKISGETIAETTLTRNKGCFACVIGCGRATKIDDPLYQGHGEGPEYETVELMGADCGIDNLAAITKANYICNELGMDTISAACTVATAMELKQEIPAYDPRGVQGMGLTYATSNRGACHVRSYLIANEVLGVHAKMDPLTTKDKPATVKVFQELTAVVDAAGLCLFVVLAPGMGYDDMRDMLNAVTGFNYTTEEVIRAGERIWNLERQFNLSSEMLPEYYQLRGWDENGVPTSEKLAELGLA